MLNTDPVAFIVGSVLGFLSGLGIGGGSLLILWLTLVLGTEHHVARNMNLLFFLPAAAVSCYYRRKQGHLHIARILPGIVGGCIGAIAGTVISTVLETSLLRKCFGLLLLATGFRELFYKPKKKTSQ